MTGVRWLYAAWVTATVAALASIFFGEVMGLPICTLCWYQRVALYPLVFLLPTAIQLEDRRINYYALPLVFTGCAIAAYHNLLYYGLVDSGLTPCTKDVSCTARQLELFGFLTIPLMSLVSFLAIFILLVCFQKNARKTS